MSDGSRLRQSWGAALSGAEAQFRSLLVSTNSSSWKRLPLPASTTQAKPNQKISPNIKGKGRATSPDDVVVHRQQTKRGDILRVVLDVPLEGVTADLDRWRAVISTPEVRRDWDPAVEDSSLVEMFDWNTRITRTNYALGWPANPRDAVTISRSFLDATTLIDISTSLPRSYDEPAYLRPAPPYVRSHVHLFAWCIQILSRPSNEGNSSLSSNNKIRITCFWQHDLKALWALSSALSQQLPAMVRGLLRVVQERGHRLPLLSTYGAGVILERIAFEIGREALNVEYAIVQEEDDESTTHVVKALNEVNELKQRKHLERSIEFILPESIGWDVQISTRASSEAIASLPWKVTANRTSTTADSGNTTTFRVRYSSLPDVHAVLKVKMIIELSGGASGLRLNGLPHPVLEFEPRDPASFTLSRQMLQDTSSVSGLSFQSLSTAESNSDLSASSSITTRRGISLRNGIIRSSTAQKTILARVKRNYIYFSSLLQEPEAKWKRNYEARGVTVTQLDSIDPTLVVYRAEAVFVGVGLWDLYSTIASPGARVNWDKGYDDAILLDDVNELTELWHWRTRPNWPVNARDSVLLKTVYKSPTTVHVFSFSTDDTQLFSIPPTDLNTIRTQVDLQGWAIEALSPTTTLLTLLEQSDPRGWANKSSIPQQMINAVAGVGEFAIKNGGPPINTRLGGARILSTRYDHEKGSFKMEYEGCDGRRAGSASVETPSGSKRNSTVDLTKPDPTSPPATPSNSPATSATLPFIECELRCDLDTWAPSLDVVIDPPPQTVTCLRRHRLSTGGGGLWLTIEHDAVFAGEDRLLVIVRKGTSKERGAVIVNGAKIKVDVEDLSEREVKTLTKMKRVKPVRVPLDQPPVLGVIRRRREEWGEGKADDHSSENDATVNTSGMRWAGSSPRLSGPLSKLWTMAVEQTTATTSAAVSVASSVTFGASVAADSPLSPSKPPLAYALSAIDFLRELRMNSSSDGWTLTSDKGFAVHKKLYPHISANMPVHKGEKVVEGTSAEEVARVITNYDCRAIWDDRFDSATVLQEFGAGCHTSFVVSKGGFPFRDRGFYVATVVARLLNPPESPAAFPQLDGPDSPHPSSTTIFCASASFSPNSVESFDSTKYNPHELPIGRIMIQGWILETLDPYTSENYAIPSTRCTHVVSVDYAGSVPVAYNAMINATLPRSVLAVEQYMKGNSAIPAMRLPAGELAMIPARSPKDAGQFVANEELWKLGCNDQNRILVCSRYYASSKKFRATVRISLVPHNVEVTTPRPSKLVSTPLPDILAPPGRASTPTSSPATSPASTIRSRRISATSNPLKPSRSISRDGLRATTSSSSPAVEFKTADSIPADFLLGELVVDSKLYPNGYEVRLVSSIRDSKQTTEPISLTPILSTSVDLPISCSCHVLPSTPLHSSGMNIDSPPRHLLRFTLPTARYEVPVNEPLSLQPPTKPSWLTKLEERDSIVEIVVFPATEGGLKGKGLVVVNGSSVPVISEKDSIKLLRRELEDKRFGRLSTLSRVDPIPGCEVFPQSLTEPLAVAVSLHKNPISVEPSTSVAVSTGATDEKLDSNGVGVAGDDGITERKESPNSHTVETEIANTGFLKFLNGYPNSLFRRSSRSLDVSSKALSMSLPGSLSPIGSGSRTPSMNVKLEGKDTRLYPLSTVLIIGLISFLIGSLLRSLLTPADFIYVSNENTELDGGRSGWRELRRLIELRYVGGGWDLLIAVVRRH